MPARQRCTTRLTQISIIDDSITNTCTHESCMVRAWQHHFVPMKSIGVVATTCREIDHWMDRPESQVSSPSPASLLSKLVFAVPMLLILPCIVISQQGGQRRYCTWFYWVSVIPDQLQANPDLCCPDTALARYCSCLILNLRYWQTLTN